MAKVTSKLQVTIPKAMAMKYGIRPGDEINWEPAGDSIRVVPGSTRRPSGNAAARLKLFDEATRRQRDRQAGRSYGEAVDRGWRREDVYSRGGPR